MIIEQPLTCFAWLFAVRAISSHTWPDELDLIILAGLGIVVLAALVFGLGYWFADARVWLRACGRKLILVRDYLPQIPIWARHKTPRSLRVFGLKLPCTEQDLLQAYRLRVKGLHPDHGGDLAEFMQLQTDFEAARKFLQSLESAAQNSA